jgi:predicted anti-sigma-YlaC factor YlaD
MLNEQENIIVNCSRFEELLTDYLDKTLERSEHKAVAAHALSCPLCHSLLNDVKESLEVCRSISAPAAPLTRLEARIISATTPESAMTCEEFEGYLTDYLDGFLPAAAFHRWERHAAVCTGCEDLPGMVVRSIGALYTYKTDELALPSGLHERILQATIGTAEAEELRASWTSRAAEWLRGLRFPIGVPQLAPVAMMMLLAFLVFSETVSADGTISGVYQKSIELAGQTYQQSADALSGKQATPPSQAPVSGTMDVSSEGQK